MIENGNSAVMKNFWIRVKVDIPYPKEFEYTEKASFAGTAVNRALKKVRKELPGKHLETFSILVKKLK